MGNWQRHSTDLGNVKTLLWPALFWALGCGAAPLPPQAIDLNARGVAALAAGALESADSALSVALEYSPRFVDALVNLGLVECQRGNFTRARTLLQRARRLNPDVAQPHHALGVLAERERRPDRASEHYWEALHVDPGFAPARENLGRLQFEAGQFDAAKLTFEKLTQVAPDAPSGYSGLAEALLRLGRTREADEVIERAHASFRDDAALALLQARSEVRRGELDQARAHLTQLAERHDDHTAPALGWLATLALAEGNANEALALANRALGLVPDEPVALHAAASALEALGDMRAPAWSERARKLGSR